VDSHACKFGDHGPTKTKGPNISVAAWASCGHSMSSEKSTSDRVQCKGSKDRMLSETEQVKGKGPL